MRSRRACGRYGPSIRRAGRVVLDRLGLAGAANAATGGGGGDARAAVVDVAEVALATKAFSSSQWEARLTGLGKRFAAATRSGMPSQTWACSMSRMYRR